MPPFQVQYSLRSSLQQTRERIYQVDSGINIYTEHCIDMTETVVISGTSLVPRQWLINSIVASYGRLINWPFGERGHAVDLIWPSVRQPYISSRSYSYRLCLKHFHFHYCIFDHFDFFSPPYFFSTYLPVSSTHCRSPTRFLSHVGS